MFFDDIVDKNPEIYFPSITNEKIWLKDAVLFRIESSLIMDSVDCWKKSKSRITEHVIDYARVPYPSIFFYFGGNRGYWVHGVSTKDREEETFYLLSMLAFDPLADEMVKSFPDLAHNYKLANSVPEFKNGNLLPRISTVAINQEKRLFGIITLSGILLGDETNLDELKFLDSHRLIIGVIARLLTLLNCVNVRAEKCTTHPPDSKIQKVRQRKGKLPLASYYTLKIDLEKGTSGSLCDKSDAEYTNRIHICRGHFKRYTEENPLFGKYTGLWWWQPSVRGRNREGIIYKDYELEGSNGKTYA